MYNGPPEPEKSRYRDDISTMEPAAAARTAPECNPTRNPLYCGKIKASQAKPEVSPAVGGSGPIVASWN